MLAAAILLLGASPAAGTEATTPPVSGDDRATVHPGNIKQGDCAAAGLSGSAIEVETTIVDNTYITITSIPSGGTLTGVVVKGSDGYNVYSGDIRTDLHSPIAGGSNKPAQISHWFACGTAPSTTSVTTSPGETTTETSAPTSGSETSGSQVTPTSVAAAAEDELAATGASVVGLLIGATVLLLIGGGLVYLNRRRASSASSATD